MQKTKPTLTLDLEEDEKFRLRFIAMQFGLTIGRGSMADSGSIQKLVKAIANGQLLITSPTIVTITTSDTTRALCFSQNSTAGELK